MILFFYLWYVRQCQPVYHLSMKKNMILYIFSLGGLKSNMYNVYLSRQIFFLHYIFILKIITLKFVPAFNF